MIFDNKQENTEVSIYAQRSTKALAPIEFDAVDLAIIQSTLASGVIGLVSQASVDNKDLLEALITTLAKTLELYRSEEVMESLRQTLISNEELKTMFEEKGVKL